MFKEADIGLREQNFFVGKELFFKNFDFNNRCQNEIEDKNEKIRSRFGNTLSQKIDFMILGLHRDYPPAWE